MNNFFHLSSCLLPLPGLLDSASCMHCSGVSLKCWQIEFKDSYFGSVDHILGIHVSNFTGQNVWIFPHEPLLFLCLFPGVHLAQGKSCWEGNLFRECPLFAPSSEHRLPISLSSPHCPVPSGNCFMCYFQVLNYFLLIFLPSRVLIHRSKKWKPLHKNLFFQITETPLYLWIHLGVVWNTISTSLKQLPKILLSPTWIYYLNYLVMVILQHLASGNYTCYCDITFFLSSVWSSNGKKFKVINSWSLFSEDLKKK